MLLRLTLCAALVALSSAGVTHTIKEWNEGFQMLVTIKPDLTGIAWCGWKINLSFISPVETLLSGQLANVQRVSSQLWTATNQSWNGKVSSEGPVMVDIVADKCDTCQHPPGSPSTSTSVSVDAVVCSGDGSTGGGTQTDGGNTGSTGGGNGQGTPKDYADSLTKSILFYEAQRSGKLPATNRIKWRSDSAINDCVVGGYYDAGDHVKFGLPFGAAMQLLMYGLYKFKDGYVAADQLNNGYDMIKWGTDYMLKAWNPTTHELVAQIGEPDDDHEYWGRPEDMTMNRPCYKVGPGKPATDLMGEWAGVLAAGFLVFHDTDKEYADKLLSAAKSMYDFAETSGQKATYTNSVPKVSRFYKSSGYEDEMCLGGMWLYWATKNTRYLDNAKRDNGDGTAWALSWDDKKVLCQLMLYEETSDSKYKSQVESFLRTYRSGDSVPYTPCGLAWRSKWGATRYAANAALVAFAAAKENIDSEANNKWGLEQINYILGDNNHTDGCFSFEIGYGTNYPENPHHRAASCPDLPAACDITHRDSSDPSPQKLVGGLVGGPDQGGNYQDIRTDHIKNEVALDYNAGFQSALAAIIHLIETNDLPSTQNKCPCK